MHFYSTLWYYCTNKQKHYTRHGIRTAKWNTHFSFWRRVFAQLAVWAFITQHASGFCRSRSCLRLVRGFLKLRRVCFELEMREKSEAKKSESEWVVQMRWPFSKVRAWWLLSPGADLMHWQTGESFGSQSGKHALTHTHHPVLWLAHEAHTRTHTHPPHESFEYSCLMCLHLISCRDHLEIRVPLTDGWTGQQGGRVDLHVWLFAFAEVHLDNLGTDTHAHTHFWEYF